MSRKVKLPQINPFTVDEIIADDNSRLAFHCFARGCPSNIVVAALLAPGIPSSTPE